MRGEIADDLFDALDRGNEEYNTAIERTVALCFFCVDGFSWEVYGKDQAAIARAFSRLRRMEGIDLSEGRLRGRDAKLGLS